MCWAAADRSSAAKGDSLRVTPLADEKKVRSFAMLTACDGVYCRLNRTMNADFPPPEKNCIQVHAVFLPAAESPRS